MRLRILCLTLFAFGFSFANCQNVLWQRDFPFFQFFKALKLNGDTLVVAGYSKNSNFPGGPRLMKGNGDLICDNLESYSTGILWESNFAAMSADDHGNLALGMRDPHLLGSNFSYTYRLQTYQKTCSTIAVLPQLSSQPSFIRHASNGKIEYLTVSGGVSLFTRNPDLTGLANRWMVNPPPEFGSTTNAAIATDSVWYIFGGKATSSAILKVRDGTNNYTLYTPGLGYFIDAVESPSGDFVATKNDGDSTLFARVSRNGTLLFEKRIKNMAGQPFRYLNGLYGTGHDEYLMIGRNPFNSPIYLLLVDATGNVKWEYNLGETTISGSDFFLRDAGNEFWVFYNVTNGPGVMLKIQIPAVGIEDSESTNHTLLISPNPSDGRVVIQNPGTAENLEIFDGQGRLLRTAPFPASEMELDVSGLAPGMYLIRAVGENGVQTARFIKN